MAAPFHEHPSSFGAPILVSGAVLLLGVSWNDPVAKWTGLGFTAVFAAQAMRGAFVRWRVNRAIRRALRAPGKFGSSSFATLEQLDACGLTARRSTQGLFLAAFRGELLFYDPETHLITIAPAGGGKTSGISVPNTLLTAVLAPLRGMLITDKDGETAAMCWRFVKAQLTASTCLNPYKLHDLPNAHLNRVQSLIELAQAGSPEVVDAARDKMLIIVTEPEKGGDNKFFRDGARDIGAWVLVFLAFDHPDRCNLPDLLDAINGGEEELIQLFTEMQFSGAAAGQVVRAGKRFASLMRNAERTFAGQISELQQALSIWDSYSTLGRSTRRSDFHPSVIKDGPAIVFLVIPEDKVDVIAKDIALVIDEFVKVCMRHPNKEPRVVFLLDEFQRLPMMKSIPAALYRGRGSGLTIWPIIQDGKALDKTYGKEASAFRTQADVVQMFGIRDVQDAVYLETRIGQRTVFTEGLSQAQGEGTQAQFNLSYGQQGAPYMRKDEVLQTPEGKQFIVFKSLPVIYADTVRWWDVDLFQDLPEANPKEGPRPPVSPRYFLKLEKD